MRINDITNEMTGRAGDLSAVAQKYVDANIESWKNDPLVANIDEFDVKHENNVYTVWDNDILVATTTLSDDTIPVVDQVWVNPKYRGQKVLSKLLWFYKTREGHNQLLIGAVHSKEMQEILAGGLSRMKKYWYKDGVIEPFDPNDEEKYSWGGKTGWSVMLENTYDYTDFPRWTTYKDFIRESYDWQIE